MKKLPVQLCVALMLALSTLLLTTGCASMFNKLIDKPKIDLDRVSVRDADLTGATLLFIVKVANPNKVDIKVDEIAYKVFINGKEMTKAKTEKVVSVPAEKTAEVEIPLPIEYTKIFADLKDLLTSKTAQYRIEGDAKLAMFTIPFKKEGQIQVRGK